LFTLLSSRTPLASNPSSPLRAFVALGPLRTDSALGTSKFDKIAPRAIWVPELKG
jgi:hypothetical protein